MMVKALLCKFVVAQRGLCLHGHGYYLNKSYWRWKWHICICIIGPNHYTVLAWQDACTSWLKDLDVQLNYQLQNCSIIQPCLMSIVSIWLQALTTLNNLFTLCPYKTLTILNPLLTYLNSLRTPPPPPPPPPLPPSLFLPWP